MGDLPDGIIPDVTFMADFFILDSFSDRTVEVSVEIPATASYVAGTSMTTFTADAVTTENELEPFVDGNILTWIVPVMNDVDYELAFDIRPSVTLGDTTLSASARILGVEGQEDGVASIEVTDGNEPNNFPTVSTAGDSTVFLTYVNGQDDNEIFAITVAENDQLSIQLSGLSADLDMALYADPDDAAIGASLAPEGDEEPLIPIADPDQNGANSEPLADFRRIDLEPAGADLGLLEVSNSPDTETEVIITDRLEAGTYYLQVFGANGAENVEPAALQVSVVEAETRPDCANVGTLAAATIQTATPSLATTANTVNTAFLVNYERFEQLYSLAERNDIETALNDFVTYLTTDADGSTLGVDPIVIPIEGFADVQAAYDAWDADTTCDPETANAVVGEIIDTVIDPLRDQLEHIVIVGGDDIIPMARLLDETTVANEYDFRHEFSGLDAVGTSGDEVNAFTAVPWDRRYLSDEPFGESQARDLGNRFLYVSDIALGRLVEEPGQIISSLTHFQAFDGSLNIQTGQVLGYDFLIDGSEEVAADLGSKLTVDAELADGLEADNITAWDDVAAANSLLADTDVVSLNAHFDHYRALPAIGDQVPGFDDNLETNDVFGNIQVDVVFSMGCHGGLSVSDLRVTANNQDWAETFADSDAVFVGNTGFGYGDTEAVAYSERLMALFAEQMVEPLAVNGAGSSSTIGQALIYAKNQYYEDNAVFSVYDEKALMEATFYGLPFYTVGLAPTPLPAAPENTTVPDTTGIDTLPLTISAPNDPVSTSLGDYFSNPDDNGDDPQVISVPGYPVQPSLTTDISVVEESDTTELAEVAHGAIVLDMTSTYSPAGFDPVIADAVFNESGEEPPVGDVVFPAKPVTINTVTTPAGVRQSLVLATGQFSSEQAVQRTDDDLDVLVYFSDPSVDDFVPPTIGVVDSTLENGTFTVTLDVEDLASDVTRVYLLIAEDPAPGATVDWVGIDLQQSPDPLQSERWSGSFQTTANEVEFMVQAVDNNGNVGFATNKARNFLDDGTVVVQPPTPDLETTEESTLNNTGWYQGDATVTVTTTDPGGAEYSVDGGPPQSLPTGTSSFDITGDGLHTWEVTTASGNQTNNGVVLIDNSVPPVVEIASPTDGASYLAGTVPPFLFSCEDPSLQSCDGTIDGGPFDEGATNLPDDAGPHTIIVTSTDVFETTIKTITYTVFDATITVTESPVNLEPSGWYSGDATIDVTTDDPAGAEYSIDGEPFQALPTGSSSFVISDDGSTDYEVRTASQSDSVTGTVMIDASGPPIVTLDAPTDGTVYAPGAVPALDFSCSDVSPVICEAFIDGAGIPTANGAALPDSVGVHTIEITGTDAVGEQTILNASYEVVVASTPPVVVSSSVSGPADPSTATDVTVGFTGDAGTTATIDWGDGTSCSAPGATDCAISDPTATADGQVTGSHVYADAGPYTITVTLTSPAGASVTETLATTTCTIVGTNGSDWLWGTSGDDVICGLGGRDIIIAGSGADTIFGGSGNDWIHAGGGNDTVWGQAGRDKILGSSGNDIIDGGADRDWLFGHSGSDTITGGSGPDYISGSSGNDIMSGGDGNDALYGSSGNDTLRGDAGADWLFGGRHNDDLDGGDGNDRLYGQSGSDDLDGGADTDFCSGGSGTDTKVNCE